MSQRSTETDASALTIGEPGHTVSPPAGGQLSRRELREQERLAEVSAAQPGRTRRRETEPAAGTTMPAATTADAAPAPAAAPAAPAVFTLASHAAAPARMSQLSADRMRKMATKGFSVAAMAIIALVAVSTSLPAAALLSTSDVQAAVQEAAAAEAQGSELIDSEPADAQSVAQAGTGDSVTIERDGFESKTVAEVAAASGIRLEATFTNNPNGTVQWPFPVGVHIGSKFGYRDCAGCSADHQGLDFNPGLGAPIQSIADGVVTVASEGGNSLGVYMVIEHQINGETISSAYAHMISGSMLFSVGDTVKVGDIIGKVGNTGMSTGPHLHFEIRLGGVDAERTNPLPWLYANTN